MANGLEIDKLSIEIESNSLGAVKSIDNLIGSLERLNNVNVNVKGLKSLTNSITKINQATSSLNNGQFSSILKSLSSSLNSLNGIDKSVSTTINSLSRLGNASKSLNSVDIGSFTTKISSLSSALKPLSEVGKISLGSSLNQLKKLPETIEILKSTDLGSFANQMKRVASAISPLAEKSARISTIFNRLPSLFKNAGNQLDSYSNKVTKASSRHKNLLSSLSSMVGKFTTLHIALGIGTRAFANIFEESSSYIENLNLFNVAMGDATNSAMVFAKSVQDAMGIDMGEWMKFQGSLNMMITGFGVASNKAQIMSQNLTQLAYDYGSLMNVDTKVAFDKINSAMSGQIKGLKEFGNNVSVATVKETGLKYGLQGAVASWDQNTQAIMRYVTIMNNASKVDVFNDMARTINTPANATRILTQQLTMLKRSLGNIGSVLATTVIPYIQVFVKILTQAANFVANLFGFELPKIDYSGLAGGGTALDDLNDSANNASGSVDKTNDSVKKLKKQLMGFDELNIISNPNNDSNKGAGGNGVGGGGSIGDIELPQYDFLQGLENSTDKLLESIKNKLEYIFEPVSKSWDKYGLGVINSFKYEFSEMTSLIQSIGRSFGVVWQNGTGEKTLDNIFQIVTNINYAVGNIANKFNDAWNNANTGTKIIQNLWDVVNILLDGVKDITKEFDIFTSKLNFNPIIKSVEKLTSSFKELAKPITGIVKDAWTNILQPLAKWTLEKGLPSLINSVSKAFSGLGKILDALKPYISVLGNLATSLLKVGGNSILEAIDLLAGAIGVLGDIFKKFPKLSSGVVTALGILYGAFKIEKIISTSTAFNKLINVVSIFGGLISGNLKIGELFKEMEKGSTVLTTLKNSFNKLNDTQGILSGVSKGLGAISTKCGEVASSGGALSGVASGLSSIFAFLAANPLVAVIAGVAALGIAFIALSTNQKQTTKDIEDCSEATQKEIKQMQSLKSELDSTKESSQKSIDSTYAQVKATEVYISKLKDMTDENGYVSNLNSAKSYVEQINSVLPGTVELTDKGTLSWKKNDEEIQNATASLIEQAKQKAYMNVYQQALENELTSRQKLTVEQQKYNERCEYLANNIYPLMRDSSSSYNLTLDEFLEIQKKNDDQLLETNTKIEEYKTVLDDATVSISVAEQELGTFSEKQKEISSTTNQLSIDTKKMSEDVKESYNSLDISSKISIDNIISSLISQGMEMERLSNKTDSESKRQLNILDSEKTKKLQAYAELTTKYGLSYEQTIKLAESQGIKLNNKEKENLQNVVNTYTQKGKEAGKTYVDNTSNAIDQNSDKVTREATNMSKDATGAFESKSAEMMVNTDKAAKLIDNLQTKINKLSGKTVEIMIKLKKSASGLKLTTGDKVDFSFYANGGFPNIGETFIAREKGPELVGRIGNKNAVMNNNQIVSAVSSGVYSAMAPLLSGGNGGDVTINATFTLDSEPVAKKVIKYHNGIVTQTGKSPLNI